MVCMLNDRCAAVCLDTTEDDIVEWLKAKRIEIIPASFKETMTLAAMCGARRDRVLSTLAAKDLNGKLRAAGFEVYDPDMTMFTWAGGGVHCMCQPCAGGRLTLRPSAPRQTWFPQGCDGIALSCRAFLCGPGHR